MKKFFFIIFVFAPMIILSQNNDLIKLIISDTVIVKKKKQDVLKVDVKIEIQNNSTNSFFYFFNKFVPSTMFINAISPFEFYKESSIGLNYVIENLSGKIIDTHYVPLPPSFENSEDEIRYNSKRKFVSPKLKIEYKLLTDPELLEYDLAKFEVTGKEQNITLYPLIDYYHKLSKGEYYLYFIYSFHERVVKSSTSFGIRDDKKPDDSRIFRGSFVSNKVKLIVK